MNNEIIKLICDYLNYVDIYCLNLTCKWIHRSIPSRKKDVISKIKSDILKFNIGEDIIEFIKERNIKVLDYFLTASIYNEPYDFLRFHAYDKHNLIVRLQQHGFISRETSLFSLFSSVDGKMLIAVVKSMFINNLIFDGEKLYVSDINKLISKSPRYNVLSQD